MPIGAAIGATGLIGAGAQIYGAQSAAKAQGAAASQANNLTAGMYLQNFQQLAPFINNGQGAASQLALLTGTNAGGNPLTAPLTRQFQPTMAELAATPGYQFSLDQGLRAVQNSNAAKGLATSGNALKGAADYAEGLAGTTFQQQLQNYLAQNQQTYNMLAGQVGTGLQGASALAGVGTTAANQMGQNIIGAGNAQGAANIATGNAIASGASGVGNLGLLYSMGLLGGSSTGGSGVGGLAGVSNPLTIGPGTGGLY